MKPSLQNAGKVYLVGAGPGDPGLITVRGAECLRQADVVVYDRLVNPALLAYAPAAELIDVGKEPEHHPVPQTRISKLLIEHACSGKSVVRLKGGDPFVFGRGGEEALALAEAGIPFEIVPGISSAIAAPAYAGIPVTHRDLACSVAIITGHRAGTETDPSCDWRRAACAADTLVFLMGVHNLAAIATELIGCGRGEDTPVAVIEQATWPQQRVVTGGLAEIATLAEGAGIRPPAVIVVGEVVRLRESLRWYDGDARGPE